MSKIRDCDINELPNCTIVGIYKLPGLPKFENEGVAVGKTFYERYKVIIGGPDPCACGDVYFENAQDYVPPVSPNPRGFVQLPELGRTKTSNGVTFTVTKQEVEKDYFTPVIGQCREVCVKITYSQVAGETNDPKVKVTETDIPTFPCQLKFNFSNESIPAEVARWMGFYDYKGDAYSPDFLSSDYVCLPLNQGIGDMLPITNSAGVSFNPPLTIDRNVTKILVARPFLQVNINSIESLKNTINCDEFFAIEFRNGAPTRAKTVKPYTAKITGVHVADDYTIDSGAYFTWLTLEMTIRNTIIKTIQNGSVVSSEDFGWDDLVLNSGLGALKFPGLKDPEGKIYSRSFAIAKDGTVEQILDRAGNPITEPELLTENGITPTMERVIRNEQDVINGVVCSAGRKKEDIRYLRWRHYDAVKYASDTTLPGFFKNGLWPATQNNGLPSAHFPNWAGSGDLSDTILATHEPETC